VTFKAEYQVETLVVGAGVIGSAVAYHLARLGMKDVRVIDFDLEGSLSSSELNAGGVRATWIQPINIEMSKITIDYLAEHAEEVGYRDCGYLWLHPANRIDAALKARERHLQMGWPVEVWDIPTLQSRVPFIDKTDGIAGVLFGPRDGLVNPNRVKNHFRDEARKLGVVFDDRTMLRSVEYTPASSHATRCAAERFEQVTSH
jgi:sarcosine oxidase subunit beta